ncbi:MAG: Ig-like domain-containing protein [Patescibacteria group bacterium]
MRRLFATLAILLSLSMGAIAFSALPASAQVDPGLNAVGQTVKLSSADPRVIATNIINIALGLVGIVLVSLIVYAGFLWMTSGGNEEQVSRAKRIITSSIIGLIIILSAWAIARFVIERLLQATQNGGGTSQQGGGGTGGGGFGGGGASNSFQVKSISPQGSVSIRNIQIKMLFSRPVDDNTASAIVITKNGGAGVAGTLTVNGAVVTFVPSAACPAPNASLFCFDGDSDYTVQIGASLRSAQGQAIVCGGFAPACSANFHTGNSIDTQPPTAQVTAPQDGQGVPADSLVTVSGAATDDSGVSYIEFTDNGNVIDQAAPSTSSTPTNFSGDVQWDTAGIPLQSVHALVARSYDIDSHDTQSTPVSVVVRAPSCFNGVKDGAETDIDCGGTPNTPGYCGVCSGGSCTANNQCSSGVCQTGSCVVQPTITSVSPLNGQVGTFVTMKGLNFGSSGTVLFLGAPGPGDDVAAQAPAVCAQFASQTWSQTEVIVAVPAGAVNGPIEITNAQSNLKDGTNDGRGPHIADYIIDNSVHPGLCGLDPNNGFVGEQFKAVGQGFGSSPSSVIFGTSSITSFAGWSDGQVLANTPVVGTGNYSVRVKVGTEFSNPASYLVKSKSSAASPVIGTIDPSTGPKQEYVTLTGTNFGGSIGTVRFKNKTSGQEALGDTAFPAACTEGYWKDNTVIIKVPNSFITAGAVIAGDYAVRLIRSDAVESNEVNFSVTAGTPKPGICAISPTVGPLGTPVTVSGEHFTGTTGSVTFQSSISGVAGSWANTEMKTVVPTGAVTGPVKLNAAGQDSNNVNFQVRNCNEQAGICSQNEQCCGNGTCISKTQICAAITQKAMFAWQSSTGLIPIAPRVVEECTPNVPQAPLPSPSPWNKRAGGDQVCVSATITMRFTTKLEPTSVVPGNFHLKKCTSASTEPCATTTDVPFKAGSPLLQAASQSQDAVFLDAATNLDTDSTYLVEVLTGIKGFGPGGASMGPSSTCGTGVGYCFRFKTRASNAACAVGAVSVAPQPYELNDAGATVGYTASPLSSDDQCVVLKCDAYDWSWENGDGPIPDGRAVFKQPLVPGVLPNSASCHQVGIAVSETGNVPVHMNATVKPDNVKGTGDLYVKFVPPHVVDYAPKCDQACSNALVWASFNTELDPASIAGNIEIRPCANENCIEGDLGTPLPIVTDPNQLTTVPKSSDTKKRFLQIKAVDSNGTLLLLPGQFYHVLLKGGTENGIRGANGVAMTGLNHPDGFTWNFRTKLGQDAFCTAQSVDVAPGEKFETQIGARQLFTATAFGTPDQCSAQGQMLIQTDNASWVTSDNQVSNFFKGGAIDTGGTLPARCDAHCLAMGSQGEFGKVAACGNGIIETTDAAYCAVYNAAHPGGHCSVLPAGAKDAEQCDPNLSENAGLCDAITCLWKPVAQVGQTNGTCGNSTLEIGEMCDFGSFCMGASSTADMTPCNAPADKASCVAGGGSCAPRAYQGCSAFCRHTGSAAGGSMCGNGSLGNGEDCDDGNNSSNDGCSSACLHTGSKASVASVCGNAILEPGETCEKVQANDPTFPAGCDAKMCLHTGVGLCDNDPATPNTNCCSNSTIDSGEDCDDGNKDAGDGCGLTCLLEGSSASYVNPSFCSDGILEVGEQCEVAIASNNQALLTAPNNAASPVPPPIGVAAGDGVVDGVQLAYIVGNGTPDATGLMSSELSTTLLGKTGKATYGLQCGFTSETSCSAGTGLTDLGCCDLRPEIEKSYPPSAATNVCRNVQVSVTFNSIMNAPSVVSNVQIAAEFSNPPCAKGTTQVTDDFTPVKHGIKGWASSVYRRVVAFVTGNPAYAAVWCVGTAHGKLVPVPGDAKSFTFQLDTALDPNTKYRIKFLGDDSDPANPLSDNDILTNKKGIRTAKGVVTPYDGSSQSGPLTWTFTTGNDVCTLNLVQVTDTSTEHPLLFTKQGESHPFIATPVSIQTGVSVPISPTAEYSWTWDPWTTADTDVLQVNTPVQGGDNTNGIAQKKNGNTFMVAWLHITADAVSTPSTTGQTFQGTAPVTVSLCENPWPSLSGPGPLAPFRDKQPTGNGQDSSLTGSIFETGPYFNFSTTYCRDAGGTGVGDDLPGLLINFVPTTTVDTTEGILRQYLFTYGPENQDLKKDGIGIRIAANPLHLSPEDWYRWRGFGGSPKPITIDGYHGLQDGNTTYIAAANVLAPGQSIYSNIYLISRNPDASQTTQQIYDQMVKSLAFNINLTTEVSNVCETGNDPNVYGTGQLVVPKIDHAITCSTDAQCLSYGNDTHCGSFKLKLARDTVRLSDYQKMSRNIESYYQTHGFYPKLDGGTFLQGFSTSRWSSWTDELGSTVGATLPKDPVNVFLTCGRCSESQGVCTVDTDCPSGQACKPQQVGDATYDPQACWDNVKRKYLCPTVGVSPSRMYQYRAIDGGVRYELSSEFEIPKSSSPGSKWWTPSLITEIKRCSNAATLGFLCTTDSDCRPCPNPQDPVSCPAAQFPIPNAACKPANGRFIYQDSCINIPYGQGGTCGDGAIGSVCVGGPNAGNGCSVNTDCPSGACTGTEFCEVGQTQVVDCKTDPALATTDGLKVQVCSECKAYVDDANLSQCTAGVKCGNGRVDKKCVGGSRDALACLSDSQCPSTIASPNAYCGPTGEMCDDGSLNGSYGHCNLTCSGYASYCGDGQLSPGETCDAGASNGAYCSGSCGNTCAINCKGKAPQCGDGIVDAPNEACDGQTVTTVLGICTAGTAVNEPCSTNADCGTGGICASSGPLATCQGVTLNKCSTNLKLCLDPGTTYQGSAFDPASFTVCQVDSECNNGKICRPVQDAVANCTDNSQCSAPGFTGTCDQYPTAHIRTCSSAGADKCTFPIDPGSSSSWSSCKVLNFCGDGILNAPGEACDDGAGNGDTKACTSSCKKNVCGDGKPYINVEECDNGAQNGSITCNADYGSTCASCSNQCKFLTTSGGYCGDQTKNGGEQCDGNETVASITDQYVCPSSGKPSQVCPYVNADCLQSPCQKTIETGVTCKSLGYDFAKNGIKPKLKLLLDPAVTSLDDTISGSNCSATNGMKGYEWLMYKQCLGAKCIAINVGPQQIIVAPDSSWKPGTYKYKLAAGGQDPEVLSFANPLPSANDFWACVKQKGPALGVGITTDNTAELLQCGNSCNFTGCGKCSDEVGTGVITGQIVDSVYNQVVPTAKISLMYKGVLVSQTSTDDDGNFSLMTLNDRSECSQYKIVVEKYSDNPCTGSGNGRPSCDPNKSPDWNYPYTVDEGSRGGYWPLTSQPFGVGTFTQNVGSQGSNRIYLFPRPGVGEAYLTVLWDLPWSDTNGVIWGASANHVVMPKSGAMTMANGTEASSPNFPSNYTPLMCDYDSRPASVAPELKQCVRDVTFRTTLKGNTDLSVLPNAYYVCLHKAGETIQGFGDWVSAPNNCPVEGRDKCLQAHPGDLARCNRGQPAGDPACAKEWWNSCDVYSNGPLTTYLRYSAYTGSVDPIRLYWGNWDKSAHPELNVGVNALLNRLQENKYRAVVSTDTQLIELSAKNVQQSCGKDCKFWNIASINPTDGSVQAFNSLVSGRPEGVAMYDFILQDAPPAKFCMKSGELYNRCNSQTDCTVANTVCQSPTDVEWSRVTY